MTKVEQRKQGEPLPKGAASAHSRHLYQYFSTVFVQQITIEAAIFRFLA
jgi:hypothetical protein